MKFIHCVSACILLTSYVSAQANLIAAAITKPLAGSQFPLRTDFVVDVTVIQGRALMAMLTDNSKNLTSPAGNTTTPTPATGSSAPLASAAASASAPAATATAAANTGTNTTAGKGGKTTSLNNDDFNVRHIHLYKRQAPGGTREPARMFISIMSTEGIPGSQTEYYFPTSAHPSMENGMQAPVSGSVMGTAGQYRLCAFAAQNGLNVTGYTSPQQSRPVNIQGNYLDCIRINVGGGVSGAVTGSGPTATAPVIPMPTGLPNLGFTSSSAGSPQPTSPIGATIGGRPPSAPTSSSALTSSATTTARSSSTSHAATSTTVFSSATSSVSATASATASASATAAAPTKMPGGPNDLPF